MYQFLYDRNPAPRTVQRTWEAIVRVRDSVEADKGNHDSYWNGYTDALTALIEELQEFQKSIENTPRTFGKG